NLQFLGEEFTKAQGNKEKQDKIKALGQVIAERDALSRLHYAPLTTRLVEAEMRARGFLDPNIGPGAEVPDSQIKMAYDTMAKLTKPGSAEDIELFGVNGKEINEAKQVFATSEKTVKILHMDQQQKRAEKIIGEIALAKKGEQGNPEDHLRE